MKEYKRLTERIGKGICIKETSTNDNKSIWNAIDRLAELEDKIENGTLIELPCKVGDTVYFPIDNGWDYAEIDEIYIFQNDIVFEWAQYDRGYELTELWDDGDFSIKDIGETVFLTREEADAKLKELRDKEDDR